MKSGKGEALRGGRLLGTKNNDDETTKGVSGCVSLLPVLRTFCQPGISSRRQMGFESIRSTCPSVFPSPFYPTLARIQMMSSDYFLSIFQRVTTV